jgi:CRP-like cAMP-binding protein
MIASLIDYLSNIISLSPGFKAKLEPALKPEYYKAHQIVHALGQLENRLWYLDHGFARTYYFDQEGKEHTLRFYGHHDLIFSYKGFWKEPADYYLEVLEPSTLISLSYESLFMLSSHEEIKILMPIFIRHQYEQEQFKCRMMTWTADERYKQLRQSQPDVFRKAPVRMIASFLNMTRENLSKLMSRDLG